MMPPLGMWSWVLWRTRQADHQEQAACSTGPASGSAWGLALTSLSDEPWVGCVDQIHLFQPQWLIMSVFDCSNGEAKEDTILSFLYYTKLKLDPCTQDISKVVTAADSFNLGKILDPVCNAHRLLLNVYNNKQKVSPSIIKGVQECM